MKTLSPQPYKGTRDVYPEDMRIRNYIFQAWRRVVQRYGYQEYAAPLLEPLEAYEAKSGNELANEQTYSFTDRGGREVAVRPELTPSVSRMIAARRQELGYPARLFNIGNFMRYERPQRGREREFWQLNLDIFGADGVIPEAEVIIVGDRLLKELGAKSSMYRIRINNRELIDEMMRQYLELDVVQAQLMIRLFDRKDKLTTEEFRDQAIDIFGAGAASEGLKRLSKLLSARTMQELPDELRSSESVKKMEELFSILKDNQVSSAEFDISLMRGLDYYTGTVFEFFDTAPENNRSLFGGGRYDGLVGLFGAEPIGAVGMAPGLSMTELFLHTHKLIPTLQATTDLVVAVVGDAYQPANRFAESLRGEGVNVELDSTGRKLDKVIKAAMKKQVPYMIVFGENEQGAEYYELKNLNDNTAESLSFERIVTVLADYRHGGVDDDELLGAL